MTSEVQVRHATAADGPALVALIADLGHDATADQVVARFRDLPEGHRVFVAEVGAQVVGFAHVGLDPSLLVGRRAQLAGLGVAAGHAGGGVGSSLLAAADAWAREHGCERLWVRSGSEREEAHRFYRARGFADVTAQQVLSRPVVGETSSSRPVRVVTVVPPT